jgi:hypothetical protein
VGKNVKILMPKEIGKAHNDFIARYLKSSKRGVMGKPRTVTIVKKDKSRAPVQITLGEYYYRAQRRFFATFCDEAMALMSIDNTPTLSIAPSKAADDDSTSLWGDTHVAVETDDDLSEAWSDDDESLSGSATTSSSSTAGGKSKRPKATLVG